MSGRVLVIDDEPAVVKTLSLRLKAAGYQTILAHQSSEGLAAAAEQGPDCILLDLHIPGVDGLETLSLLRANPVTSRIPVVLVSGDPDPRQATAAGADGFLAKPCDGPTLLKTVTEAIRRATTVDPQPKTS